MARLDKERQDKLQPLRMEDAISDIKRLGYEIIYSDETKLQFIFKGKNINYFPYSGWASGATIKDGRGIHNLLKQIINGK